MVKLHTVMLMLLFLPGCGEIKDKDNIVKSQYDEMITSSKRWLGTLTEITSDSAYNKVELTRHFFLTNSTSSRMYNDLSYFKNYFGLKEDVLQPFRPILDGKSELTGPFYNQCLGMNISIDSLKSIEEKLLAELINFRKKMDE